MISTQFIDVIQPFNFQTLEKYLIEKNAGQIFVESKALGPDEFLSKIPRTQLVQLLVDFLIQVHGKKITQANKVAAAKATVALFPCLEFAGSEDGIVSSLEYLVCISNNVAFINCI